MRAPLYQNLHFRMSCMSNVEKKVFYESIILIGTQNFIWERTRGGLLSEGIINILSPSNFNAIYYVTVDEIIKRC